MPRKIVKILSAAVFLMLSVTPVFSQSENGKVAGQVTDPQGLAVPNAKVEIINQETAAKRETTTDETGHYAVSDLPPGRYKVAVEVPGFAAFLSEDITVAPGQSVVSDAKLSVTQEKASVRVEGGGAGEPGLVSQPARSSGHVRRGRYRDPPRQGARGRAGRSARRPAPR